MLSDNVKVYPNPANDLVSLEYKLVAVKNWASVVVINQVGQQVYEGFISGQGMTSIHTQSWSPGLYMYKISSQKGFDASGSFVVNH